MNVFSSFRILLGIWLRIRSNFRCWNSTTSNLSFYHFQLESLTTTDTFCLCRLLKPFWSGPPNYAMKVVNVSISHSTYIKGPSFFLIDEKMFTVQDMNFRLAFSFEFSFCRFVETSKKKTPFYYSNYNIILSENRWRWIEKEAKGKLMKCGVNRVLDIKMKHYNSVVFIFYNIKFKREIKMKTNKENNSNGRSVVIDKLKTFLWNKWSNCNFVIFFYYFIFTLFKLVFNLRNEWMLHHEY